MKHLVALALLAACIGAYRVAAAPDSPSEEAVSAAQAFLKALPAADRAKAARPFDGDYGEDLLKEHYAHDHPF